MLPPNEDVYNSLRIQAASDVTHQEILNMAGSFLFSGDDIYKRVSVLSGGERARVCLAGLLLARHPILLLDEPTNHLDFETVEALGSALREYKGTIFFVSHDRTFVSLVANEIVEVKDGSVSRYPGNYAEYVYHLQQLTDEDFGDQTSPVSRRPGKGDKDTPIQTGKQAYHQRKHIRSQIKQVKNKIGRCERKMEEFRKERAAIEKEFETNPTNYSAEKARRLDELKKSIEKQEELWLALHEEWDGLTKDDV
jgi:ATP-binding cassette subfamily F protein 3